MRKLFISALLMVTVVMSANAQYLMEIRYKSGATSEIDVDKIEEITWKQHVLCPDDNHHHAIDLGLPSGNKWACCNLGASDPEDFGDKYCWGGLVPWNSDEYFSNGCEPKNEWLFGGYWNYDGGYWNYDPFENERSLLPADDVAHVKWGGSWRVPSKEDWQELIQYCDWEWTSAGFEVRSKKNDNFIFIPATYEYGDLNDEDSNETWTGYYWTSHVSIVFEEEYGEKIAYEYFNYLEFGRGLPELLMFDGIYPHIERELKSALPMSIRPVCN